MEAKWKKAFKLKLRFKTPQGILATESLFDLSIVKLNGIYSGLSALLKQEMGDSLITTRSNAEKTIELKMEIIKEIFDDNAKYAAAAEARIANKQETEEWNKIVMAKIAEAKAKDLDGKSVEDLQKQLR